MENRKRNKTISYRLTEEENNMLRAREKEAGMNRSQFYLSAIRSATIYPRDELIRIGQQLKEVTIALNHIGNNVNQMTKVANAKGYVPGVNELEKVRSDLNQAIKLESTLWQFLKSLIIEQGTGGQ